MLLCVCHPQYEYPVVFFVGAFSRFSHEERVAKNEFYYNKFPTFSCHFKHAHISLWQAINIKPKCIAETLKKKKSSPNIILLTLCGCCYCCTFSFLCLVSSPISMWNYPYGCSVLHHTVNAADKCNVNKFQFDERSTRYLQWVKQMSDKEAHM